MQSKSYYSFCNKKVALLKIYLLKLSLDLPTYLHSFTYLIHLDKEKRHAFLSEVAGVPESKKKLVPIAYGLVIFWFLFGFGPFAMIGNTLFSDPNIPATWAPFGLPSIWIWQLVFLFFGIFVMWFLAFIMGFSQPISSKKLEKTFKMKFFKNLAGKIRNLTNICSYIRFYMIKIKI